MLAGSRIRLRRSLSFFVVIVCIFAHAQEHAAVTTPPNQGPRDGHRATLRWQPSPDAKIHKSAKYWIYRADGTRGPNGAPQCGKNYKKHAVIDIAATSYVDTKVKPNRVYCYYMITVTGKSKKDRSGPTPVVTAVIPPDKPKR